MSVPDGRHIERGLVLLGFTALTLLLTYPLSVQPGSASLGSDPDVHTYAWTLGWDVHALLRPWAIFDANIFHPYPRTLAFSENLIGNAFIAAPVIWLTGNPVLAMNVVSLASVVLCGAGAWTLARQLGLGTVAALLCGLIFAFSPARFFRFQQIHLTAIQWIPFALAALHAYVDRGRARDLRLALAFSALQIWSSLHGGVYLALAVGVLLVQCLARGTPVALRRRLRDAGAVGAVLAGSLVVLAFPYLRVQREMGLVRTLENWIPAPESFVASPTHLHTWLQQRLFQTPINETASAFLFPGIAAYALAVAALAGLRHPAVRPDVLLYAAIAGVGIVLAAGPPLGVWPLVYWLPGFNFIRIPSRFFLLTVLGVAVLAAIGLEQLTARRSVLVRRTAGILACALVIAECAAIPLAVTPFRIEFAAADRWLRTQPAVAAIAEVPVGPTTRYHSTYMLHSMAHWQRTVHGHSSLLTPLHEQLYDRLRSFPDDASLDMLTRVGVTHVVVHLDMYGRDERAAAERGFARYAARLREVFADDTSRVYRLD